MIGDVSAEPKFAHPVEAAFARILDFYRVRWEYEPTTFPLEWDENGTVLEAFTPDFYLPEENMYLELTTLRPQLTRSKNRKLKRLRELYPQVNIKLFKRRELRNMMLAYGFLDEARRIDGTGAQDHSE